MMTEVFKTDVVDYDKATILIDLIQNTYGDYKASFDLDDCDRILVVKSIKQKVQPSDIINLLASSGHKAEVLPDE